MHRSLLLAVVALSVQSVLCYDCSNPIFAAIDPACEILLENTDPATGCLPEFEAISPEHTMCLTDVGTDIPITPEMKQLVVDRHNEIRSQVAPAATNMQKMVWDDDLATVAAKWARQCVRGHEPDNSYRLMPSMPGVAVGQNAAYFTGGSPTLLAATDAWYSEINDFTYGVSTDAVIGHYTQEIWATTSRVGCGEADCIGTDSRFERHYACNYAPAGNYVSQKFEPYEAGDSCAACPDSCDANGLCDCEGLVCYNGLTLDINTCTCS